MKYKYLVLLLTLFQTLNVNSQTKYFNVWRSQNANDYVSILKNGLYLGDNSTNSDICLWANNLDADEPYFCYDASANSWVFSNDGVIQELIGSGSGGGGINHISNGDIASNTDGFSRYNDGSVAVPVDGTGGTSSLTMGRSTNSTYGLRDLNKDGTSDGLTITKGAVDEQGEGFSYDFTIDNTDKNSMMKISFDQYMSSNYADSDMGLYVYDVSNSNLIRVISGEDILAKENAEHVAYFQTSNSTSYRLIWHVQSTSTLLYVAAFDNIKVSPLSGTSGGAFSSDWEDFPSVAAGTLIEGTTSDPTFGTTSVNKARWRREGPNMIIEWDFLQTTAGTAGSGAYLFNLPSGLSIDTTAKPVNTITTGASASTQMNSRVGTASFQVGNSGSSSHGIFSVAPYSATQLKIYGSFVGEDSGADSNIFGSSFFGFTLNPMFLSLRAVVPIQGWSTGVKASEIGSNRACVVEGAGNGGTALTSSVTNIDFVETRDDCSAWNGTEYTAQESGDYKFSGSLLFTTSATDRFMQIYKDTGSGYSFIKNISHRSGFNQDIHTFDGEISLNKGDKIVFRSGHTVASTLTNNVNYHHVTIRKINNLYNTIQPTEIIAMRATSNNGQTVANAANILFEDVASGDDTHNAYNPATGIFTMPAGATRWCNITFGGEVSASSKAFRLELNGSTPIGIAFSDGTDNTAAIASTNYRLSGGDTLEVANLIGSSVTLTAQSERNQFTIFCP